MAHVRGNLDVDGLPLRACTMYYLNNAYELVPYKPGEEEAKPTDPLALEIEKYPAYWRPLPKHWAALDYYRVRQLFPLPQEFQSARLDHALKKLLIPAGRTGGKTFMQEIKEAHATLGQWIKDTEV